MSENLRTDPTDQAEYAVSEDAPLPTGGAWPPRDVMGRKLPARLNFLTCLKAAPSVIGAFATEVPDDYWNRDAEEDGFPIAVVACPCGGEPAVRLAGTKECECGRFFLFLGHAVRVFRPD